MPCAGFRANLLSSNEPSAELVLVQPQPTVQDRHEFSLGHARPWPTAFLRRLSPQTKRIVEDLFYPYLTGTRHSLGL